jgi:predicted enzyme related to lactoylglutathione lyase
MDVFGGSRGFGRGRPGLVASDNRTTVRNAVPTTSGFYVESLDRVTEALARAGAPVLTEHDQMPWGCRVVAEDPDGRAVEINQRGHCPSP